MALTFTVYSYFNVDQVCLLLDSMAAFTSSTDFYGLVKLIVMFAFLILIAGMALGKGKDPFEFFRWLIVVSLILNVLLVPKVDVIVVDRTGSTTPAARSNIPIGFAFFASVTSSIGNYLTKGFETIFSLPTDLQFQKNGLMFGNTILTESMKTDVISPTVKIDLMEFVNSCTYYDILAGRFSQDTLLSSSDIWATMATTSNTLLTAYPSDSTGSKTCAAAYTDLSGRLATEVTKQSQRLGRQVNPKAASNAAAASLLMTSQLVNSYSTMTGISQAATLLLRQNMVINTFRSSQMVSAQRLDATASAIVGAGQAEIENAANINYLAMARVAERAAPAIRNAIEIICYAVFPIIIIMMLLAPMESAPILKNYVLTMLWIQIMPALYAVLNFVMVSASYVKLKGIVDGYSATNVTMQNMAELTQQGLSDMAIGGYLTLSIPVIAYALVKTGEIGGSALFDAAMSGATGSAGRVAGAMAAGNISQGQVSLDNSNMNNQTHNQSMLAPSMSSGFTRTTTGSGTETRGPGGLFRWQANSSQMPISASVGAKVANQLSNDAALATTDANTQAVSSVQARAAAYSQAIAMLKGRTTGNGTMDDTAKNDGSDSVKTLAKMESIVDKVQQSLGKGASRKLAQDIVTIAGTNFAANVDLAKLVESFTGGKQAKDGKGKGIDVSGAGLNLKAGVEAGTTTHTTIGLDRNINTALGIAKEGLKSISTTDQASVLHGFKTSKTYQEADRSDKNSTKKFDAALSESDTFAQRSEQSRTTALSLTDKAHAAKENWQVVSSDYTNYLAKQLSDNNAIEAFSLLSQTNPDQAAKMVVQYLEQIAPTMPPLVKPKEKAREMDVTGTTLDGATPENLGPQPKDTTDSTHAANVAKVTQQGWQAPKAAGSTLPKEAEADRIAKEQAIAAQQLEAQKQIEAKEREVAATTAKENITSPDPAKADSVDKQEKAAREALNLPPDPTPPTKK